MMSILIYSLFMCWFAGGSFSDMNMLERISKSLDTRSKQTPSIYIDKELSFFHAPLKISDLNLNTDQPYISDNCIVGLVGEIYNQSYLHTLLGIDTSISEIELIEKAYTSLWAKFINYLNGEFTIFIYDKYSKKYFLFRDRYWVHTVYYSVIDTVLYFCSHILWLKDSIPKIIPKLNMQAMFEYFMFGFSISPNTLFQHIKVLEPWAYLEFYNGISKVIKFDPYISQEKSTCFIKTLEESVVRRIPHHQKKIFMPISWGADSNLVLFFLSQHFKWEIIPYTFYNDQNTQDVEIAIKNIQTYWYKHLLIDAKKFKKEEFIKNISVHEWLVDLHNMSAKIRNLFPEYNDVHVEFSWDWREELLYKNTHFDMNTILWKYEALRKKWCNKEYHITKEFLNSTMFDFNLQLIEKLSLNSLLERRLPFTDYELMTYVAYAWYSSEAQSFLKTNGLTVVEWIYWHNTGISFRYLQNKDTLISYAKTLFS